MYNSKRSYSIVKMGQSVNNTGRFFCRFTSLLLLLFCLATMGTGREVFTLPENVLINVEKEYGEMARRRLISWQELIRENSHISEQEKLRKVNDFFNQMRFVADITHWKQKDYWATPVEFLSTDGGDCEDFSLAKYFTLKALGVEEGKLQLTYVKAIKYNQAHMVVTYYPSPDKVPLVLDNLIPEIFPATVRTDLVPVYSFNGTGLWLAKSRGMGKKVGKSEQLKRWKDVISRMPEGLN